jgi:hypothetical protein
MTAAIAAALEQQQQQVSQPMEVNQSAVSDSTETEVEVEVVKQQSAVHDSADDIVPNTVTDSVSDKIAVSDSDVLNETSSRDYDAEAEELDRLRQIYMDGGGWQPPQHRSDFPKRSARPSPNRPGHEEADSRRQDDSMRMFLKDEDCFYYL